jgi:hypothetical protein
MFTSISNCESSGDDLPAGAGGFLQMFQNPAHLDQSVRQAVQLCWTIIPKERRDADELGKQFRRVVERALKDFAEDKAEFGPSASDAT